MEHNIDMPIPNRDREIELKTLWSFNFSQWFFATVLALLYFSDLYDEFDWLKNFFSIGTRFAGQMMFVSLCAWKAPFKKMELLDRRGGFVWRSVFDVLIFAGAFFFLMLVVKERPNTGAYIEKHHLDADAANENHNLLDLPIFVTVAVIALYSMLMSFILSPGWDFTILGTFVDLLLHMSIELKVKDHMKKWAPYIVLFYASVLILWRNANESHARARARTAAQAPAPTTAPAPQPPTTDSTQTAEQ